MLLPITVTHCSVSKLNKPILLGELFGTLAGGVEVFVCHSQGGNISYNHQKEMKLVSCIDIFTTFKSIVGYENNLMSTDG